MLFVLDNYDSFTYNLVQYFGELGEEPVVYRNDAITVEQVLALKPAAAVISPGPKTPADAGICVPLVRALAGRVPVLGVCLGHQAIGQAFGGRVVHAKTLMHGKTSPVRHDGRGVFHGLPVPFEAGRYHSLAIARQGFPACLEISAQTEDGEIMGARHRTLPVEGVQFHPESVLTEHGHALLKNFLNKH